MVICVKPAHGPARYVHTRPRVNMGPRVPMFDRAALVAAVRGDQAQSYEDWALSVNQAALAAAERGK